MSFDVVSRLKYTMTITSLVIITLMLTGRLLYFYLDDPVRFPINTVKIVARYQHVNHTQLETIIAHYQQKSFFTLPVHQLYDELIQHPWVESVDIAREWPDIVHIKLQEKHAIATWNGQILSSHGDLVLDKEALSKYAQLPRLAGPTTNLHDVIDMYKRLEPLFTRHGFKINALSQRHNQAWEVTLSNGILLKMGKQDVLARAARFCKVYPQLAEQHMPILSVDLRYPEAMAVKWQKM